THRTVKKEGKRRTEILPKDQWVYLPDGIVPPLLVTEDGRPDIALFERVQRRQDINQEGATRNNRNSHKYLLRGGFIKCGYCGGNMTTTTGWRKKEAYRCWTSAKQDARCTEYCTVRASVVDPIAWSKAVEIIRDPSVVDRSIEARRTADPNAERRQYITEKLAETKAKQNRLRDRLEDEDLDDDTYVGIKRRLKELADLKR